MDENQTWKVGQAKFQGYVKAKLEDITETLGDIDDLNKSQDERITQIEKEQSKLKGIYLGIAAVISAFVAWISRLFGGN